MLLPMAQRPSEAPQETEASAAVYLAALGERVREMRARRGMTRKILARDSGVSERYLSQLEAGRGNISVLLLRQVATALDTPLENLVRDGPEPAVELSHTLELLRRLPPTDLTAAHRMLLKQFGGAATEGRLGRVALIGLRGAGKSTLGAMLAEALGCPFIELDREIETEAGAPLGAIFDLYGQSGFRRLERRCLERIIHANPRAVIATGGGIVSDPATFDRLLAGCFTVWIKASPTEHMQRVIAQGDMRPMANSREAMADLQRILKTREALYGKADAQVETTGRTPAEVVQQLLTGLR
jgi:XRE family aerobic/anaerobic benzoate catabolism transcriptional regulator